MAEEAGFVPVTADDVVTPGDNVNAKLDTLIDRASVMVVELTSPWTKAEYGMAIARLKGAEAGSVNQKHLQLIVVVTKSEQAPPSARDLRIITRPKKLTDDSESFVVELGNHLRTLAAQTGAGRMAEPRRLLEAKEYRAAVISAMTLLEASLRDRLNKSPWPQVQRPLSLRSLIELAIENQIIQPELRVRLTSWTRTRNEAVHSPKTVSKAQARDIVEGVMQIIDSWN